MARRVDVSYVENLSIVRSNFSIFKTYFIEKHKTSTKYVRFLN